VKAELSESLEAVRVPSDGPPGVAGPSPGLPEDWPSEVPMDRPPGVAGGFLAVTGDISSELQGSAAGGLDVDDRWRTGKGGVAVDEELVGLGDMTGGGGGCGGVGSDTGGREARPPGGNMLLPSCGKSAGLGGSGGGGDLPC